MADIVDRLGAAGDLDRLLDAKEGAGRDQPRQPADMVEMGVGQQHLAQPAKAEPGAHQLALGPLAAIDQKPVRAVAEVERGRAALGRGCRRRGSEKDEVEHRTTQRPGMVICTGSPQPAISGPMMAKP